MQDVLIYILAGILGVAFKTTQKIMGLQKTFAKSNEVFVFSKYIKGEAGAILSSIIAVIIAAISIDEIAAFRPQVLTYVRLFFVAVGWMGADILISLLGTAKKYILNIIDRKTNVADGKAEVITLKN